MAEIQAHLETLVGSWRGRGAGRYPTIESFEYDETLLFDADPDYPLLRYEQRTWLTDGEPSHWEAGFLRWLEDGSIELVNAQASGRVEALRGHLEPGDSVDRFKLVLESVAYGNDDRMVASRRTIDVAGERMTYLVEMSTTTTEAPVMQQHLAGELTRSPCP